MLFIIPSLGSGGAEKSLITLLNLLDYGKYDVDLMLFRREGFFLERVPHQVNIVDGGDDYKFFDDDLIRSLRYFIKKRKLWLAGSRLIYTAALRKKESKEKRELVWKYLSKSLPNLQKKYDAAIGYLEGNAIYYCVDKTQAKKKIGYIHSDYNRLGMSAEFDKKYFEKLNSTVTVSETCADSLLNIFPGVKERIVTVENIVSSSEIEMLSISTPVFRNEKDQIILLTVGRLSNEKGIDLAAGACKILIAWGYNISWYIIGIGEAKQTVETFVKKNGLEKHFILIGQQKNPYKYMAQSDIYVQPSRYEGRSIALEEAKILAKPIVATNFTTVRNQIENEVTGLIAEITSDSIAEKIKLLIDNPVLRSTLCETLRKRATGNESELEKFYALI